MDIAKKLEEAARELERQDTLFAEQRTELGALESDAYVSAERIAQLASLFEPREAPLPAYAHHIRF